MKVQVKEKTLEELQKIVGTEFVSVAKPDLYNYAQDMTENLPSWPDFAVMPGSVKEVQEVLRLANREKIPVTPFVCGANCGGLTIPLKGGISLDLKRMNRLIELNDIDMYIVVEPGFTFGHLKTYLTKNYPNLTYSYPLAPPRTSLMCNALLQGMGDKATRMGVASEYINGLEVVLPTGELVKVGSCGVGDSWFGRGPIPDLCGLFIGWQGATGVVTKIGLQLFLNPKYTNQIMLNTYNFEATFRLAQRLAPMRVVDELFWTPWDSSKIMLGKSLGPFERVPGEPEFIFALRSSANSEDELKAKVQLRDTIINEEFKDSKVDIIPWELVPDEWDIINLPTRGIVEFAGAVTWVGTYGPLSRGAEATRRIYKIYDKYRLPHFLFCRALKEGHMMQFRPVVAFNKNNPEEVERVRKFMVEGFTMAIDMGFVPYKAPIDAVRIVKKKADPNFLELMNRVKKLLDPNNIMNPGRWGDPED
jgi:FAD/FMN-containing dehydrogenase